MTSWIVTKSGDRLLSAVKEKLSFKTVDLRWAIEHHRCRVNGVIERFASRRLQKGDRVEISPVSRPRIAFEPERMLFEDAHWVAYDKPAGIDTPTLGRLLSRRVVHRLDRDTTGVILFAKDAEAEAALGALFRARAVEKRYLALVKGELAGKGVIDCPLGKVGGREGATHWGVVSKGKRAVTGWKALATHGGHTLLLCTPQTGRTHQIRVHLSHLGHPIVGDVEYGGSSDTFRPLLHALSLKLQGKMISAPLPADFVEFFPTIHDHISLV